ncbi:MAG: tol-pal system protein YbgF [Desulfuromonas sp.]|nr:MAG: tol-pal system protein YbgF [Desulfuromonas sp.]
MKYPVISNKFVLMVELEMKISLQLLRILTAALLAASVLSSCAPARLPGEGNLSLDVRRMQLDLGQQQRAVADLSERLAAYEQRLQQQEATVNDLRQQLAELEKPSPAAVAAGTQGGVAAAMGQGSGQSPTEIYLQAFGDYASGRYRQAIQGFQTFLNNFPNNSYAGNAQYWLGDCYFNLQEYAMAIDAFRRGVDEYLQSPKSPDALLKIVMAQFQLGNLEEASQTRDTLNRLYPASTASKKAAELALP